MYVHTPQPIVFVLGFGSHDDPSTHPIRGDRSTQSRFRVTTNTIQVKKGVASIKRRWGEVAAVIEDMNAVRLCICLNEMEG
jgi:hypothetical protein